MSAPPEKTALRRKLLDRRRILAPDDVRAASGAACDRVLTLPEWARARTVAVYSPHLGEADPALLISSAGDRRIVWPVVIPGERVLQFYAALDADLLRPSTYGIPAPPIDPAHRVELPAIDLFIVPALAFDPSGARLGFGKGYYDATLAAAGSAAARIGLAYEWQVVPRIPTDPHDERVHTVITEARILRPARESDTRGP